MEVYMNDHTLKAAVSLISNRIQVSPRIGVVLGSGLGSLAKEFDESVRIGFEEIPGFPVSTVEGHRGEIVCGRFAGISLLALAGRVHFYEGYDIQQVVFPIRVMAELQINTVVITNAAGAVNESFQPGNIVAIRDHINFMGVNPLIGSALFVDMTDAYSNRLRKIACAVAAEQGIDLPEGVYVGYSGPSYETPAEIRAFRTLGGDMVGMSTVPEVIAARSLGMDVLGLSLITNMAAGVNGKPLSHEGVIENSAMASTKFKALIRKIIKKIAAPA